MTDFKAWISDAKKQEAEIRQAPWHGYPKVSGYRLRWPTLADFKYIGHSPFLMGGEVRRADVVMILYHLSIWRHLVSPRVFSWCNLFLDVAKAAEGIRSIFDISFFEWQGGGDKSDATLPSEAVLCAVMAKEYSLDIKTTLNTPIFQIAQLLTALEGDKQRTPLQSKAASEYAKKLFEELKKNGINRHSS